MTVAVTTSLNLLPTTAITPRGHGHGPWHTVTGYLFYRTFLTLPERIGEGGSLGCSQLVPERWLGPSCRLSRLHITSSSLGALPSCAALGVATTRPVLPGASIANSSTCLLGDDCEGTHVSAKAPKDHPARKVPIPLQHQCNSVLAPAISPSF